MTLKLSEPFRWGAPRDPIKAVVSTFPWSTGPSLSSYSQSPQEKAARYLAVYKVGWFYKAERKISGDISRLGWTISDGDAESDDPSETELGKPDLDIPFEALSPIDQLQRLMEQPNPQQTGRQLMAKLSIRRDFAGTAMLYLENGTGTGLPTAIYGISPSRMWPARDKQGVLLGWVMDKDTPNPVPFDATEIVNFPTASAEDGDGDLFGVGVVEAVWAQVPLTDLMARHTTDLLTTGGRLAGMLWPKERSLTEDEFTDAQRAWRNVSSDSNAARRLLLFPEPMEWTAGASTPAEIGIPELAQLNQTEILTAFPISAHMLGVPYPSGLNASGEIRREERREYWEGTIQPRTEELADVIQTNIVSRYEEAMGQTFDFDIPIPNLDDAPTLIEKVGALKGLVSVGFDPKESVAAVGLEHIKWNGIPEPVEPAQITATAGDTNRRDITATTVGVVAKEPAPAKARKTSRDSVTDRLVPLGQTDLEEFFAAQQERVVESLHKSMPTKSNVTRPRRGAGAEWRDAIKADPDGWWDAPAEDAALTETLRGLYLEVGKGSLQVVADGLGRFVYSPQVQRILADLIAYGGERITEINEKTRSAIAEQLAEGTRRGYSINQLVNGVDQVDETFPGVKRALLDNGVEAFSDYRAELISRTETMLSYNRAAVTGYGDFGVEKVQAIDGDQDAECASRDGHIFAIEEALGIEDHPNGTLDWVPVIA